MTEVAHVNLFIIFIKLSLNTKLTSILFISIGHIYLYNLIRLVWLMVVFNVKSSYQAVKAFLYMKHRTQSNKIIGGHRGHMLVGFTTIYDMKSFH
jgi:hypothetical protein